MRLTNICHKWPIAHEATRYVAKNACNKVVKIQEPEPDWGPWLRGHGRCLVEFLGAAARHTVLIMQKYLCRIPESAKTYQAKLFSAFLIKQEKIEKAKSKSQYHKKLFRSKSWCTECASGTWKSGSLGPPWRP